MERVFIDPVNSNKKPSSETSLSLIRNGRRETKDWKKGKVENYLIDSEIENNIGNNILVDIRLLFI
jgi:hypothetical protein